MGSILRFPDFFVVGAPRCGTTALCRYLAKHPAIYFFSRPKETHHFTRLEADWMPERLERDYLTRFFPHLHDGHRLVGEGSVSYLYASHAIERVVDLNPKARTLVLLRDPLDMLPSYRLRMLYILAEDVGDFPAAWALQALGRAASMCRGRVRMLGSCCTAKWRRSARRWSSRIWLRRVSGEGEAAI